MKVQFPARHNELRIQCRRSCATCHDCSSNLIPGLQTPYAAGHPKEKKKNYKDKISRYTNGICFLLTIKEGESAHYKSFQGEWSRHNVNFLKGKAGASSPHLGVPPSQQLSVLTNAEAPGTPS